MNENKNCYQYKKLTFNDGFLKNSVDATYIINLTDNGRYKDIENQLSKFHPTNTVYIVFNKGYKKCEKTLYKQHPAYDLTDAFLQIFKHSIELGYNNILVLEDDFVFTDKIKEPNVCNDLNDFINKKSDAKFVYYLGCIPYVQSIGFTNHNQLYLSGGTHSCIYSKTMREHVIKHHDQSQIIDWDVFNNMNYFFYYRYTYYQPLCYQLFPSTENSNTWFNPLGLADLIKYFYRYMLLDKQVEPGYSFFYTLSKMIFIIIVVINVVWCLYLLRRYGFKFSKKFGNKR
jgi:hypothetical protein